MSDSECIACGKKKSLQTCELNGETVCKACAQYLDPTTFSFYAKLEPELKHKYYCPNCYDEHVAPKLSEYEEIMERAKQAYVFFITQKKEIPLIKKSKTSHRVESCPDRDETILRLAFRAAEAGYNAIIEVEALAKKVRNGAYQTSDWSGVGTPAQVDGDKIALHDIRNKMYR